MDFSRIQDFDMQLLHVFNGSENVWLDQMAMALTSGWTWIPLYIVLFVVVIRNNEMMGQIALVVGGAVLCIFLADGLVDGIIKPLAERWRPSSDPMFKYTVQVVDNMRLKSFSFCSAHAANTLSIAIFFSLLIRSKLVTWTLLLWSLVNCWTRLYLGVHYPVDILCGLAIGAVVGVVQHYLCSSCPIFLWLLWIIPVLILIRLIGWRRRKAKLKKLGDPELLKQLMPNISKYRPTVKFVLMLAALALLIVMVARPQMGSKISHDKRHGIETIICLDISNSMLCQDVAPSRLDKSKMLIENLVDNFNNDKIGLIVFAGDAFVQLPITTDYVSAKMFLQNITPGLIQTQGTNIGEAIDLASKSFTQQENVGRAIIVITDGENHEPGAQEAATAANKKGINVFILGIGNTKGAPIPMGDGSYLKDNAGNTVMTALNEQMCKELAQAGKGQYIHVDNTSDAERALNDDIAKLQKGDVTSVVYSAYDEQFQAVGILVILLLIIEICLLEVKNPLLRNIKFFKKDIKKPF
jgi:Ca-activated chloride channel homolog